MGKSGNIWIRPHLFVRKGRNYVNNKHNILTERRQPKKKLKKKMEWFESNGQLTAESESLVKPGTTIMIGSLPSI